MIVFLAGTLVGNIYMPQKKLQATDITAVQEPVTSADIKNRPDTQAAMKDLNGLNSALKDSGKNDAETEKLKDNIQKTLLLQSYFSAKSQYEIELLKAAYSPQERDSFLKAKNNFADAAELLQVTYPSSSPKTTQTVKAPLPQEDDQAPSESKTKEVEPQDEQSQPEQAPKIIKQATPQAAQAPAPEPQKVTADATVNIAQAPAN
jgi:hypothetical protein